MNPRARRANRGHNYNNNNNQRRFNNTVSRNTVLDSLGPAGKLRGTAFQLVEKYLAAAKDAHSSDRVLEENCLQHAEHYMRLNALAIAQENRFNQPQQRLNGEGRNPEQTEADNGTEKENLQTETQAETDVQNNREETEKDAGAVVVDLSVPVAIMAEKAQDVCRKKALTQEADKAAVQSVQANENQPVRRRGRPAKKKIEIAAQA